MVQVLPYVPSFLEQISPQLNQILGGISTGVGAHYRNKADQSILSELQSGNTNPINYPDLWSRLSPETREIHEPFLQSNLRMREAENKEEIKRRSAQAEKQETREELIPVSQNISSLIDKAAYGAGSIQDMAELDTSGFWFTDKVYTHFNKGVVSNIRFENMKNELSPNSRQRPSVNRARLASLTRMAGLPSDISSEKFDKILDKEIKNVEKIQAKEDKISEKQNSSSLTEEVASKILSEAGGDPQKARQIAKERGYEF